MGTSCGKIFTVALAASSSLTEGRMRCCAAHCFVPASRLRFTPSVFPSRTTTVPLQAPSSVISMGYRHSNYAMRSEASLLSSIAIDSRESEVPTTLLKTVEVTRGKARLFWDGNPLVYGGAVSSVRGNPKAGDIVDVVDSNGKFIAWGVYNPDSMYRVRVFAKEGEPLARCRDVSAVLCDRLKTARDLRRAIGIPCADTDTYRLVNSEGDRLSGLVIDVFAGVICVSSSATWVELFRPQIEAALREEFRSEVRDIVWRRSDGRLQQDGWKGANVPFAEEATKTPLREAQGRGGLETQAGDVYAEEANPANHGVEESGVEVDLDGTEEEATGKSLWDTAPATVVRELGLQYEVQPRSGQKTGFYCDQRESRDAVRKMSPGKRVLDMFCYSGGFALNAAFGGAVRVVAVDSSQPALEAACRNAARNGLQEKVSFVKNDALDYMKAAATNGDLFDLVVLDPPKLAPNKKALPRATSRYRRLNAAAIQLVAPGGILVTFTCSAAMTQSGEFIGVIQSAAAAAGRTLRLLRTVSTKLTGIFAQYDRLHSGDEGKVAMCSLHRGFAAAFGVARGTSTSSACSVDGLVGKVTQQDQYEERVLHFGVPGKVIILGANPKHGDDKD